MLRFEVSAILEIVEQIFLMAKKRTARDSDQIA